MHCPGLLMRTIILLMRRHSNQLWDSESPSILIHIWPPTSTNIHPASTTSHPARMISHKCVCVYGGRIGKSKYKLSLSNKYWCFRISWVAMPDFVTFFGSLRLVPADLTFIVCFFSSICGSLRQFCFPMITILYELCLLHPPSHAISLFRHQTQKTQIKCAPEFPVIFMPKPIYGSCTGFPYPLAAGSDFFQVKWDPVYGPLLNLIAMSAILRFLPPAVCDTFSNKSF